MVTLRAVMWQGSFTWEWTRSTIGLVGTSDISDIKGDYYDVNDNDDDYDGDDKVNNWTCRHQRHI